MCKGSLLENSPIVSSPCAAHVTTRTLWVGCVSTGRAQPVYDVVMSPCDESRELVATGCGLFSGLFFLVRAGWHAVAKHVFSREPRFACPVSREGACQLMRREDSNAQIREIFEQRHEIPILLEFFQIAGTSTDYGTSRAAVLCCRGEDRSDGIEEILRIEELRLDLAFPISRREFLGAHLADTCPRRRKEVLAFATDRLLRGKRMGVRRCGRAVPSWPLDHLHGAPLPLKCFPILLVSLIAGTANIIRSQYLESPGKERSEVFGSTT